MAARWGWAGFVALMLGLSIAAPAGAGQHPVRAGGDLSKDAGKPEAKKQAVEDPAAPEDEAAAEAEAEGSGLKPKLTFGLEGKAHFRNSADNRFKVNFGFKPEELPPGQKNGFEETVNQGSHFEVSTVTLYADAAWSEGLAIHGKVDFIDLYDRNPTSSDHNVDVDELYVRFGRETPGGIVPERGGVYLKVGKFPHFERQNDRHLESYGLVSTAFNRFEDEGAELGVDFGRHVYVKLSATSGNPVFMRDPNALAGDNGTPIFLRPFPNPDPTLKSGIVILYDAEVEDLGASGKPELGGGVGLRFGDPAGSNAVDFLAWAYQRKLAKTVELNGTFYGGDLDLLNGPFDLTPLAVRGDEKKEVGANLWVYLGGLSVFGQYVDQKLAGLPRKGMEAELAWRFDLPLVWALGERQLLPAITPVVRWSKLDNSFRNHPMTPSPSFAWDWQKIDAGVRVGIVGGLDTTVEYADNDFILGSGAHASNNELLATLRWKI